MVMFQFGLAKTVSQHFTKGSVSKLLCKSGDHRTVKTYQLTQSNSIQSYSHIQNEANSGGPYSYLKA